MTGERRSPRRPAAKVSRLQKKLRQVAAPRRTPRPQVSSPRVRAARPAEVARAPQIAGPAPRPLSSLRGTPLQDPDIAGGRVSVEHWDPRLVYRWDTGVAIGRFLEGLREGKILGVRCHRCNRTVTPPRAFCEWCFKPMDEWVELAETGTVNTFSICYVTWDLQRLEVPQVPAVIEIDGTSPRVGFLHLIGGLEERTIEGIRRRIRVGGRVRAVWKPAEERTGAITDIRYFIPV